MRIREGISRPPQLAVAYGWCRGGWHLQGERCAGRNAVDMDASIRASRASYADAPLRGDARGRDGGVRQELAARVITFRSGATAHRATLPVGVESGLDLIEPPVQHKTNPERQNHDQQHHFDAHADAPDPVG